MSHAIEVEGLVKRFGAVTAVDGLDLNVRTGSIFGFLGPNGAGKTTTIHLLLGLVEPTAGTARLAGHDVRDEPDAVRAASGVLLEHHGLYERMSAEDNLELHARIWGLPAFDRAIRVRELLKQIGLWDRRKERVGTWSKGMKSKLAVARALLHRPALLFLDEPTAGLDPVTAAELRGDLVRLAREEQVTVFLTTHNLPEAERVCDRVGVIHHGRLLAEGPPDLLGMDSDETRLTFTGTGFSDKLVKRLEKLDGILGVVRGDRQLVVAIDSGTPAPGIVSEVVRSGAAVEEVHKARARLEDVFLALTRDAAQNGRLDAVQNGRMEAAP